jgi:hypothetical protein
MLAKATQRLLTTTQLRTSSSVVTLKSFMT